MRELTQTMIRDFKIMKLGMDMMGYKVSRKESLSFHHLIVPRRECKHYGLGDGYYYWNGAILVQRTSHEYLHLVEAKDYDMFCYITSEIIDENIKGKIDVENLKKINDVLTCFEKEYGSKTNKKGKYLIKREYIADRVFKNVK